MDAREGNRSDFDTLRPLLWTNWMNQASESIDALEITTMFPLQYASLLNVALDILLTGPSLDRIRR